jgi:DNA invertase Pin-like site-specific DNA recombinase
VGPVPAPHRRTSAKAAARARAATVVVGYLRCSTDEQAASGLGLEAQRAAVEATCAAKGWNVGEWCVDEGVSGSVAPAARPGMARALRLVEDGEAGALVVARLDRCSRDSHDFTGLLKRAARQGWSFVALDLGVDTSTPVGRMVAEMMMSVAQWERARISERTREALAAKKARGERLGRPVSPGSEPVRARLRELLHQRLPLAAVAATMNAEGFTTPTGLAWTWRHVQKTRDSLMLDDLVTV